MVSVYKVFYKAFVASKQSQENFRGQLKNHKKAKNFTPRSFGPYGNLFANQPVIILIVDFSVRYMKVMELHWQCQKVITHLTNLRRFMQSHNYDDKVIMLFK